MNKEAKTEEDSVQKLIDDFKRDIQARRKEVKKKKAELKSKGEWPGIYKQSEETIIRPPFYALPFSTITTGFTYYAAKMRGFKPLFCYGCAIFSGGFVWNSFQQKAQWATFLARIELSHSLESEIYCSPVSRYRSLFEKDFRFKVWEPVLMKCQRGGHCSDSLFPTQYSNQQVDNFSTKKKPRDGRNNSLIANQQGEKAEPYHSDDSYSMPSKRSVAAERLAQKRNMIQKKNKGSGERWENWEDTTNTGGWSQHDDDEWGENKWDDGDKWSTGDQWSKEK